MSPGQLLADRAVIRVRPDERLEPFPGLVEGGQRLVVAVQRVECPADDDLGMGGLGLHARVGSRLGGQRLPRREHGPVRRQGVLLPSDLVGQVGQL